MIAVQYWQLVVEVNTAETSAPAYSSLQIFQEFALEIDSKASQRLPGETDSPARKSNIVARFDTIQVFKEKTTTGEAVLLVILSLKQEHGALCLSHIIRWSLLLAVPCPEALNRFPAVAYGEIGITCSPGITQCLASILLEELVTSRRQVIQCTTKSFFPTAIAFGTFTPHCPASYAMSTTPRAGRT